MFDNHFDPVVLKLIDLLKQSLPGCPEGIFRGYHFVIGALARTGGIDKLPNGLCRSDDFTAMKSCMASFMAAGFVQACRDRAEQRQS